MYGSGLFARGQVPHIPFPPSSAIPQDHVRPSTWETKTSLPQNSSRAKPQKKSSKKPLRWVPGCSVSADGSKAWAAASSLASASSACIKTQQQPTPHCSATHSGLSLQPLWPKGVQGRASLCVACRVGQGHGLPRKYCVFNPALG